MLNPRWVFCVKAPDNFYAIYQGLAVPDLPSWAHPTTALLCLRSLFVQAALDEAKQDLPEWNPLGSIIKEGDRVVIKPNWVHHSNGSGQGMDCLVTHTSVIEAILHYVIKARPHSIVVCDAPIQGCDFGRLMAEQRVPEMIERFAANGITILVKDLRRTIRYGGRLSDQAQEDCRPMEDYILYDLGSGSMLEPITGENSEFRVTMYNPDVLKQTHARGKHQYLVARDVIEADVVINVPKLKTHKKAGITGALKNIVGINGHKEYLPHHRKGGSDLGGDCYHGASRLKGLIEDIWDEANRARGRAARRMLTTAVRALTALGRVVGTDTNYEGSWHGNDTVWRMALDLQRVLHYGLPDGTLSNRVQRKVLTITDAIIAGEGDGPLSPTPIDFGMMTMGSNTAATEWVHAVLMGLDPQRIPLIHAAFIPYSYPLTRFPVEEILIWVNGRLVPASELFSHHGRAFRVPKGWRGYCELGCLHQTS